VTLRHGRREEVRLEQVPADRRAPVLKTYLKRAPGERPHLPVHKDAPLSSSSRSCVVSGVLPGRTEERGPYDCRTESSTGRAKRCAPVKASVKLLIELISPTT
jgi:hypothetical protein